MHIGVVTNIIVFVVFSCNSYFSTFWHYLSRMRSFLCATLCKACKNAELIKIHFVNSKDNPLHVPVCCRLVMFCSLRHILVTNSAIKLRLYFFFQIEEDLTSLQKKHSNLENEFDTVNEKYQECQTKMEEAEKTASEVSRRRFWRHLSIFGGCCFKNYDNTCRSVIHIWNPPPLRTLHG